MSLPRSLSAKLTHFFPEVVKGERTRDPIGTASAHDFDGRNSSVTRPNGVTSSWSYDPAGRVDRVDHVAASGIVGFFDYSYDAAGNRVPVGSLSGVESYTINLLNQLVGVSYPDGTATSFAYDAAGNRVSETTDGAATSYVYDAASRLTSVGGVGYSYDEDGNHHL